MRTLTQQGKWDVRIRDVRGAGIEHPCWLVGLRGA